MANFQRARTDEQRAERRTAILDSARTLLEVTPLDAVTLAALARESGMASSAVLRYFDSREAVLLELVLVEAAAWLEDVTGHQVAAAAAPDRRCAQAAAALADTLVAHPRFCELISVQTAVLERNVSTETAIRFKTRSTDQLQVLADWLRRAVPEIGPDDDAPARLATYMTLLAGALWAQYRSSLRLDARLPPGPVPARRPTPFKEHAEESLLMLLRGATDL